MSFATHFRRASALPVGVLFSSLALAQIPEALPVCVNNGPYTAECTGQVTCVPVTSAGSFDPDGTPVTVFWFDECPDGFFEDQTAPATNYCFDMEGQCLKTCLFALRVFSGGQMSNCTTTVTVEDTLAPVISCPPDFTEIWAGGPNVGQVDPAHTGSATAVDCSLTPVIAYSDVSVGNTMAGEPELVVTRTWTATDNCMHQSSCVQTITLLSPGNFAGAILDVVPSACPNMLGSQMNEGVIAVVIYGSSTFDVANIDRPSLMLRRLDNSGTTVPIALSKLVDRGRSGIASNPNCGSPIKDGRLDLQLVYRYDAMRSALGLNAETPGATVGVAITGRLIDGRYFTVLDDVTTAP